MCKLSRCNLTKLEAIQARHPVGVGGRLLRHHRGFLVGLQVMHVCVGLVTGSASALTRYLASGALWSYTLCGHHHDVKKIFPYINKDRLRPFEYKLDTICNMQPHMTP